MPRDGSQNIPGFSGPSGYHDEAGSSQPNQTAGECVGYTKSSLHGPGEEPKEMLMVVMSPAESVRLKAKVKAIDPGAFVIVSDATEVLGHGFASH